MRPFIHLTTTTGATLGAPVDAIVFYDNDPNNLGQSRIAIQLVAQPVQVKETPAEILELIKGAG